MKFARIVSAGLLPALLIAGRPALAEGWSLAKLMPQTKKETKQKPFFKPSAKPSPLEQFNDDLKKLNEGTKRFFTTAWDTVSWKKPAPKKRTADRYVPWLREPKDPRDPRRPKKQKKSWWDSLFGREESKRVKSMKDWVGLPRLEM